MSISPIFIVKHLRPYGLGAYAMLCETRGPGSLFQLLVDTGVDELAIKTAFEAWETTAGLEIGYETQDRFVYTAAIGTLARWSTVNGANTVNTVLFMDGPALCELSAWCAKRPDSTFDFTPDMPIPVAVDITQVMENSSLLRNVSWIRVGTNHRGCCTHLDAIQRQAL